MPLIATCSGVGVGLQAAYIRFPMSRADVDEFIDLPPIFQSALSNVTLLRGAPTHWNAEGAVSGGAWDSGHTYGIGDWATYEIGTLTLHFVSLRTGNLGHPPDAVDGWWTCMNVPPCPDGGNYSSEFAYAIDLDAPDFDASLIDWWVQLTHSLSWTVTEPGDQVAFNGIRIKYIFDDGSFFEVLPGAASKVDTTQGKVISPGPYGMLLTWHTSGLSDPPTMWISGWPKQPDEMASTTIGDAYSATIGASGGTAPYTFRVSAGRLPSGTDLNPTTGEISGTPDTGGVYQYTVMVTDAEGNTATVTCGLQVGCGSGGDTFGNSFY